MYRQISGNYNLNNQADFDLKNTEEVRLSVLSSVAPTTIILPPVSELGALNLKIWVADIENNAAVNNIVIQPDAADNINNAANYTISQNNGEVFITLSAKNDWLALTATAPSGTLLTAETTITEEQLLTLNSLPVEVIAGVAGSVISVVSATAVRQPGDDYDGGAGINPELAYGAGGDTITTFSNTIVEAAATILSSNDFGGGDAVGDGQSVVFTGDADAGLEGTGTIFLSVIYRLVPAALIP